MDLQGPAEIGTSLRLLGELLATNGHAEGTLKKGSLREPPEPLPSPLVQAARAVARDLGLDPDWLNAGPALQWRAGMPPGLEARIQ